MAERKIGEAAVFGFFADPGLVFSDSKKDDSLLVATGKSGTEILTAVFNPITESIVTVRAASKKERRAYGEHSKN